MRTARTTTEAGPPRPGEYKERDATVLARVAALKRMAVNDLKAEWKTLFGSDAPNNSRGFLELRLAHRIQELTYGGVARETTKLLNALADEVEGIIDAALDGTLGDKEIDKAKFARLAAATMETGVGADA